MAKYKRKSAPYDDAIRTSQKAVDILLIAEQLPSCFLSSLFGKLTAISYVRLRRSCSFMNTYAKEKVKTVYPVKNKSLTVYFEEINCCRAHVEGPSVFYQIEISSSFGFHFRKMCTSFQPLIPTSELLQIEEMLSAVKCDKRRICDSKDVLCRLDRIEASSIEILSGIWDTPLQLEPLVESAFEKFDGLSILCKLSPHFDLTIISKHKSYLDLKFSETWEEVYPMFSQFLQDVYNDIDVGNLKEFSIWLKKPCMWTRSLCDTQTLSNHQLGNVPFLLLYRHHYNPEEPTYTRGYIHYCETTARRILLSVYSDQATITVKLFIVPIDDFSTFIEKLGYLLFQANFRSWLDDKFPLDYSRLSALLEGIPSDLYPAAITEFTKNLYKHMNKRRRM